MQACQSTHSSQGFQPHRKSSIYNLKTDEKKSRRSPFINFALKPIQFNMNYDLASAEYLIVLMSSHIEFRSRELHSSDSVLSREGPRGGMLHFHK